MTNIEQIELTVVKHMLRDARIVPIRKSNKKRSANHAGITLERKQKLRHAQEPTQPLHSFD